MNQNNNYSFDPMTGQPINQKSVQPTPVYQQPFGAQQPKKKVNSKILIIIAIAVVVVIAGIVLLINQHKNNNSNSAGTVDGGTNTTYDENGSFLFRIEDVFTISGRGTVVTGTVERGTINLNDAVQIVGLDKEIITTTVTGIEIFRKDQDYASVGDTPGLLLKDVTKEQVERGQVVAKPNSIISAKKFDADISVISTEDGGRSTPFFDEFKPQFYFRTLDITGKIDLPDNVEMVSPGENVSATVTLSTSVAMEVGTEFSIREGGRIIANGIVTKVY